MRNFRAVVLAALLSAGCAQAPYPTQAERSELGAAPVFLIGGQSNARGRSGFVPYDTLAADSLDFSAWPTFAAECQLRTGRQIAVVNTRVGGSAQTHHALRVNGSWDERGVLWDASVAAMDSTLAAHPELALAGIVWMQGEADANAIDAGLQALAHYQRALERMIARYRAHYGPVPFYIVRTGRPADGDRPGWQSVRTGQRRVVDSDTLGAVMAYEGTINFPLWGMMVDQVHYSVEGLQLVGRAVARAAC